MDSYIPFETALMFLVTAYLVSVMFLLVVADVAIAAMDDKLLPRINAVSKFGNE